MKSILHNKIILALVATLMLSSCETVIEVDLNSVDPQVVIEAQLVHGEDLLEVRVSRTSDYFGSAPSTPVTNANLLLYDGSANAFPVPHLADGWYQLPIQTSAGESYRLEANVGGVLYQASATMPQKVRIDSLRSFVALVGGGFGQGSDEVDYNVLCRFRDPAGESNYYRLSYLHFGQPDTSQDINVVNDNSIDGGVLDIPVQFGGAAFHSGDTVLVTLRSIDAASYNYYQGLSTLLSSGGNPMGGSTAPGNPEGNWTENALGNFSLASLDTMSIVIP